MLSGCIKSTIGLAVMGNSSFDSSFAQAQDIAQDFRFAPACANLRARSFDFAQDFHFTSACAFGRARPLREFARSEFIVRSSLFIEKKQLQRARSSRRILTTDYTDFTDYFATKKHKKLTTNPFDFAWATPDKSQGRQRVLDFFNHE